MSAIDVGALSAKINAVTNRGLRQATAGTYSFTPTVTGWHVVRLQAAGGAGGGGNAGATGYWGGCAGEFVEVTQWLIAGTPYSYTVPGTTAGTAGNGASGADATFVGPQDTITAKGGGGGTSTGLTNVLQRRDGVTTSAQPALFAAIGVMFGANGGSAGAVGGYCGRNAGGSASTGGGGGSSRFGIGGTGGASWGNPGSAGGTGAGGGGAASNGSNASGGAGGGGVFEIEFLGTN